MDTVIFNIIFIVANSNMLQNCLEMTLSFHLVMSLFWLYDMHIYIHIYVHYI